MEGRWWTLLRTRVATFMLFTSDSPADCPRSPASAGSRGSCGVLCAGPCIDSKQRIGLAHAEENRQRSKR
jgi:hypothetical protein